MRRLVFLFVLFLPLALPFPLLHAESPDDRGEYQERLRTLESLLESIVDVSERIAATQQILQGPRGLGREKRLREKINELSLKLRDMEETFDQLATDVGFLAFEEKKKVGVDWNQELQELLGPVLREVKKMTSHPRELEKLRAKIDIYSSQLEMTRKAIQNLFTLQSYATSPKLIEKLNGLMRMWQDRQLEIRTQMNIAIQRLDQRLEKKKPISETIQELLQIFFKSRGRNILFALFAFAFVWVALHYLHKLIRTFSPFHKQGRSFSIRIFDMLYIIFTVVVSLLTLLGVLYSFGDWVLLSVAVIFILGVGWASKQALPKFWSQVTLMLNFGSVREGEVVIHKGIPYEVSSINIYSELANRKLGGGFVRLHIKDLVELRSRPIFENEPWFPSECGDWVILNDGGYGKVVGQTPDLVEVKLLGGATKTYKTIDYLAQSPMNLSSGFRIPVTFGIDYGHQAVITREIPEIIERAVTDGLRAEGFTDSIANITVQFKEAGPSSLDVAVLADFNKSAESRYAVLERAINRICVDTCNLHHWVIPFHQVTVHMAEPKPQY